VPSLGFGLVSTEGNTLLVRNETTASAPFTIPNAPPPVAVSPNGHEIAYWRTVPSRTGGAMWELFRSDLIDPAARDIGVMSAPAGEDPGPFVWSSDGTGLVVNTGTARRRGAVAGPNAVSRWSTVDVTSSTVTGLPAEFERAVGTVYAWDRQRDLISGGGVTAQGQSTFITLHGGRVVTEALRPGSVIAAADAYGRSLVIAHPGGCRVVGQTDPRCAVLESRDQATFTTVASSPVGEATAFLPSVTFRPRSQDLIVQLALPNGDARVELWSDLGRGPHQRLSTYTRNAAFTLTTGLIDESRRDLILPRVDGSAVFLLKFDGSSGGRWFGEIVSLAPNYSQRGGQDLNRTPFEIQTGGNPIASVVLDPAFARAMATPRQTSPSPSPARPGVAAGPDGAIRTVQQAPAASMFVSFPTTAASRACDIRGGGPAPGLLLAGTCRTDVQPSGSGYVVTFAISWDAQQFHLAGEPSTGQLQHSWTFTIDADGVVTPGPESGNFPPQYVR
jgi:hypothetical protein